MTVPTSGVIGNSSPKSSAMPTTWGRRGERPAADWGGCRPAVAADLAVGPRGRHPSPKLGPPSSLRPQSFHQRLNPTFAIDLFHDLALSCGHDEVGPVQGTGYVALGDVGLGFDLRADEGADDESAVDDVLPVARAVYGAAPGGSGARSRTQKRATSPDE